MKEKLLIISLFFITVSILPQNGIMKPPEDEGYGTIYGRVFGPDGTVINDATIIAANPEITEVYGETVSYYEKGIGPGA